MSVANNDLALETWKTNMQDTLMAINQMEGECFDGMFDDDLMKTIRDGWLDHLDDCQSFSGPRIVYPPYVMNPGVYVKRNGVYRGVDYGDVSPQEYITQYYTSE